MYFISNEVYGMKGGGRISIGTLLEIAFRDY